MGAVEARLAELGLTLPEVSPPDLQRIRDAAGPGAEVVVTSQRNAHEHAEDVFKRSLRRVSAPSRVTPCMSA